MPITDEVLIHCAWKYAVTLWRFCTIRAHSLFINCNWFFGGERHASHINHINNNNMINNHDDAPWVGIWYIIYVRSRGRGCSHLLCCFFFASVLYGQCMWCFMSLLCDSWTKNGFNDDGGWWPTTTAVQYTPFTLESVFHSSSGRPDAPQHNATEEDDLLLLLLLLLRRMMIIIIFV